MSEADALEILAWHYDAPYDFYDPSGDEMRKDIAALVEPTNFYLAVRDGNEELIGYYCFGEEAQVIGGDYSENALDIFGTSRPDILGTGIGEMFVRVATDFGQMFFTPDKLRATIAAFNTRALRMCEKAGFTETSSFTREDGTKFVILIKDADPGAMNLSE
jgi:RimJ/RimL family protein N-acetyltransferase